MSIERETVIVGSGQTATTNNDLISRDEKKARLARVLERGFVPDRLIVDLPNNLYGEWVPDDPVEIARLESMGFHVDTEYSTAKSLHSTGAKQGRVGDAIFMVCDSETKEIIDEIRREQYNRAYGKKDKNRYREEKEASGMIEREGLATFAESKEHTAKKADIEAALQAPPAAPSSVLTEKI